jgi:exonuclease SbcD
VCSDEHGPVAFYPLTYLKPDETREIFAKQGHGDIERSHQAIFENLMDRIRADIADRKTRDVNDNRSVVIAHAFVTTYGTTSKRAVEGDQLVEDGVVVSDSERHISVGGLQTVTADTFDGATYVALGHLHGAQKISPVASKTTLRYSGSILKYSLSEIHHKKSFVVVHLDNSITLTDESIEVIPIPQPRQMVRISATTAELLSDKFDQHVQDYVDLTITDERVDPVNMANVRKKFEYIVATRSARFGKDRLKQFATETRPLVTDIDIIETFFDKVAGAKLNDEEREIIHGAIENVTVAGSNN